MNAHAKQNNPILMAMLLLTSLALCACSNATAGSSTVSVTGVNLSASTLSMMAGGATEALTAAIVPADATNTNVTWASSAESVATVSTSGVVSPVAAGSATITVTTADGSKTATCAVTVGTTAVAVTGVIVSPTTLSLTAGGATGALTATIVPANATNTNVTWASSASVVATVSTSGVVTPVAAGSATITVTTADGSKTAACAVTVAITTAAYTSSNIGTLKYIPAGTFQPYYTATNTSTVSAFHLSQNLITQAQYTTVTGNSPSYCTGDTSRPVERVTWYDAVEFCNKLSTMEGLTSVYTITDRTPATGYPITSATVTATWTNNGYRLPTEMEYLWAAMGATSDGISADIVSGVNTGGYLKGYAGSTEASGTQDNIGNYAWTYESSSSTTHPVGTKTANELGLYDMSGNVWEWFWDLYADYPATMQPDYQGATSGTERVLRGGAWGHGASNCVFTIRNCFNPNYQSKYFGFRVARP